jgi:hypothetical protein
MPLPHTRGQRRQAPPRRTVLWVSRLAWLSLRGHPVPPGSAPERAWRAGEIGLLLMPQLLPIGNAAAAGTTCRRNPATAILGLC